MRARRLTAATGAAAIALSLAACGSSPSSARSSSTTTVAPTASTTTAPGPHGTASLAMAGSLEGLAQTSLEPGFEKATGDHAVATFDGSSDIAQAVLDGELSPGAFVAVGTAPIELLWPKRSHFVMTLATDPLVVAYSPKSPYAAQLGKIRSGAEPLKDLFTLMERPGFRLGRTNPNLDPQGGYFELMFKLADKELHLPSDTASKILGTTGTSASADIGSSGQVVDEDSLPTDISTATVDAGSEYLTEARQYKLDYISLPNTLDFADPSEESLYSSVSMNLTGGGVFKGGLITLDDTYVLPPSGSTRPASETAADEAWLAFLISAKGQSLLRSAGYSLEAPKLALAPGFHSAKSVLGPQVLSAFDHLGGTTTTG